MSNALTLSQPGMWTEVHRDAVDAWQVITRMEELTKKIAGRRALAELLDEALMTLDDGLPDAPFIAAADVLHMARVRNADHQRQQADASGHGAPTAQFTAAPAGNGAHAQVTQ